MKSITLSSIAALSVLIAVMAGSARAQSPTIQAGDRVLFYGDSITEQRLYTAYVETFMVTRYPEMDVEFIARGVGGDTTWGGWLGTIEERVARDVKPYNPSVITVMLGMNDGGYVMPQDPGTMAAFVEWYGKLLGLMNGAAPDARLTLIGSSPYDDVAHADAQFRGYNDALVKMIAHVRELAHEKGYLFADFNEPVKAFVESVKASDAEAAATIVPDTIHPAASGHLVMAAALLKAWNVTPVVSDVGLDAASHAVTRKDRAEVSGFEGLAWRQKDAALPFPIVKGTELAAESTDFHQALNRQTLTVTGLPAGVYRLDIDRKPVTEQPAEAWAAGVNLAALETPMREQAQRVFELTALRSDTDFTTWRDIVIKLKEYPASKEASEAMARAVQQIQEHQRRTAQPVEHQYQLTLVTTN